MQRINIHLGNFIFELLKNLGLIFTFVIICLHKYSIKNIMTGQKKFFLHPKGLAMFLMIAGLTAITPLQIVSDPKILIDLRAAPIVLAAVYLGVADSLVVGAATVLLRWLLGGSGWILWAPAALLIGPVCWWMMYHTRLRYISRKVLFGLLGTVATVLNALALWMTSYWYPPLHEFYPPFHPEIFLYMYITLFFCNPLAVMALDHGLVSLELHQKNVRDLRRKAHVDEMTGLFNYRYFRDKLEEILEDTEAERVTAALLMIDVDSFKQYNDSYGHPEGDYALKVIGHTIVKNIRQLDIAARYGGEEFVVILPGTSLFFACNAAERIRRAIQVQPAGKGKLARCLTVSVGVAVYPQDGTDPEDLISAADQALYTAKRAGKNRVRMFGETKSRK